MSESGSEVERTDDGRYIVVDGRRWRATDPALTEPIRRELVSELMAARRAVKAAGGNADELAEARSRVHDAKVALGERGEPWWEVATEAGRKQREAASERALARARRRT